MRDQEDCTEQTDMSLTGRISRLERILDVNRDPMRFRTEENFAAVCRQTSPTEKTRDRTSLEEILQQLACTTEHGEVIVGRLEDMNNRVFGYLPEDGMERGDVAKMPEALVDQLFIACARLSVLMGRLENAQVRACRIA
jgi:hypothetical protein